jgi:hypothetical protein
MRPERPADAHFAKEQMASMPNSGGTAPPLPKRCAMPAGDKRRRIRAMTASCAPEDHERQHRITQHGDIEAPVPGKRCVAADADLVEEVPTGAMTSQLCIWSGRHSAFRPRRTSAQSLDASPPHGRRPAAFCVASMPGAAGGVVRWPDGAVVGDHRPRPRASWSVALPQRRHDEAYSLSDSPQMPPLQR